ncbi:MAG: hypothetical protein LUP97_06500 [Methanoregula sp.]|nr:hypothetical protein [Methanoregula sp.]
MSVRVLVVLAFGVISLIAAIMNDHLALGGDDGRYLMFMSTILIFVVAGLMYKSEKEREEGGRDRGKSSR